MKMKKFISFLILVMMFLIVGYANGDSDKFYKPFKGKEFENLKSVEKCEDGRFVVGFDENRNKLIDACYSLKYINEVLVYKRVNIYYHITDDKEVTEQGCVCN